MQFFSTALTLVCADDSLVEYQRAFANILYRIQRIKLIYTTVRETSGSEFYRARVCVCVT